MGKNIIHPIRQDYLSGMSFAALGEKYSIDPRTAKRYALNNLPLENLDKRPFSSVLDSYKEQIDIWLLNGPVFASTIHDRLIEIGCKCGYTIVNDYVRAKIQDYEKTGIYHTHSYEKIHDRKSLRERMSEEKRKIGGNQK